MNINPRLASFSIPVLLLLVACGAETSGGSGAGGGGGSSSTGTTGSTSSASTSSASTGGGAACTANDSSTLPGVSISIGPSECTFTLAQAAAGISIPYTIEIPNDVPNVIPARQGGCAAAGPSGLYPFEWLAGNNQKYCLCDEGLCNAPGTDPVTLPQGSYPGAFAWDGKNWLGPSDFGQPKGEPFTPGDYTLEVSATGQYDDGGTKKDFKVASTLTIHLVP